jgi:prophage regulatory protein
VARGEVIEAHEPATVEALLSADQVGALFGVHRSTVFRLTREDDSFPRPLKLSRNTPRWRATELNAWIASRAAARDA